MIIAIVFSVWVIALTVIASSLYMISKTNNDGWIIIIISLMFIGAVPDAFLFGSSFCLFQLYGKTAMLGSLILAIIYFILSWFFIHLCCSFFEGMNKYEVTDEILLFSLLAIFTVLLIVPANNYLVENGWDFLQEYAKIF